MLDNIVVNSPDAEAAEEIAVDLDAEVEVEDSAADGNAAAPIPEAGFFPVKFTDGEEDKAFGGKVTKPKAGKVQRSYVGGTVVGKIQDEGQPWHERIVSKYINSLTFGGRPTSDVHHFLNCAGQPAPNKSNVGALVEQVKNVLAGVPAVWCYLDWEASYPAEDSTKDEPHYIELVSTMKKFPVYRDAESGLMVRLQSIPHPKTGEPVNARLVIKAFYTDAEAKKRMQKA